MAKAYSVSQELLGKATDLNLLMWSTDSKCLNREECAALLRQRQALRGIPTHEDHADEVQSSGTVKPGQVTIEPAPFDPQNEVSADARHIVKHLWIIFVLLPFALAVLWLVLTSLH